MNAIKVIQQVEGLDAKTLMSVQVDPMTVRKMLIASMKKDRTNANANPALSAMVKNVLERLRAKI